MTDDRRDLDLLARLNSLRPSSVTLKGTSSGSGNVQSSVKPISQAISREDRLADRLKTLRSSGVETISDTTAKSQPPIVEKERQRHLPKAQQTTIKSTSQVDALIQKLQDEVKADKHDAIRDWHDELNHRDGDDDPLLDELLAQIGSGEDYKLDPEDPQDIAKLLEEARQALAMDPVNHGDEDEVIEQPDGRNARSGRNAR